MTAQTSLGAMDAPPVQGARRPRIEPRSPFLSEAPEHEPSLDELVRADHADQPLVVSLLCDVEAIAARLLDPRQLEGVVRAGLALTALAVAVHAVGLMAPFGALAAARAAGLAVGAVLLGLAAALGPIYGTSVVVAARLPMAQLVAVLLAAVAAGALVLAGLTPLVRLAFAFDLEWAGPLGQVAAFAVMGAVTGVRLSRLLLALAEGSAGTLTEGARFRVGILGRMALAFSGLTTCLALWAFDAFLVG